jgi:hypothetical protein
MKIRKALKRLNKVESLLSAVIDGLPKGSNELGDLLTTARESVVEAKRAAVAEQPKESKKKPPARAQAAKPNRLSAEGRRNISAAAKKRWANARRKGVNPVTGNRLRQTA